ncbi:MAG: 5-formyltetrahydrofolate cyclo-ligase [Pirellulaceae bacterium]
MAGRSEETLAEERKWQRAEGVRLREAIEPAERRGWDQLIESHLVQGLILPEATTVGFCWPYKSEFDARSLVSGWAEAGVRLALPRVQAKCQPLIFNEWYPQCRMTVGTYGIPVPEGTPELVPDLILIPVNGFDPAGYRLGYGGGYFDRTLAAIHPPPVAVGVGYELLRLQALTLQPFDLPMDFVVTEAGLHARMAGALQKVSPEESAPILSALLARRELPRPQAANPIDSA